MCPAVKKSISVLAAFFAVWLAARFLLPLCFPFLLGALLAFAAEPMVGFLQKRRVPRCVCSGIGVSMAFCFLAMLVLILCAFALRELRRVAGVLPDLEDTAKSGIGRRIIPGFIQCSFYTGQFIFCRSCYLPCFITLPNGLLQLPGGHVLNVIIFHELRTFLCGQGRQGEKLGIAQLSKRLGIGEGIKKRFLIVAVLPIQLHPVIS